MHLQLGQDRQGIEYATGQRRETIAIQMPVDAVRLARGHGWIEFLVSTLHFYLFTL